MPIATKPKTTSGRLRLRRNNLRMGAEAMAELELTPEQRAEAFVEVATILMPAVLPHLLEVIRPDEPTPAKKHGSTPISPDSPRVQKAREVQMGEAVNEAIASSPAARQARLSDRMEAGE